MFSFESLVDLPLIWYGLIATAIFLYILLDGFDLGVGILFPFAPTDRCRDRMMNSIAPFWDGNETWLILGGGGREQALGRVYRPGLVEEGQRATQVILAQVRQQDLDLFGPGPQHTGDLGEPGVTGLLIQLVEDL